eukprot:COSAG01_NODE_1446_length_10280_cov_51.403791_1_plen_163_part_00
MGPRRRPSGPHQQAAGSVRPGSQQKKARTQSEDRTSTPCTQSTQAQRHRGTATAPAPGCSSRSRLETAAVLRLSSPLSGLCNQYRATRSVAQPPWNAAHVGARHRAPGPCRGVVLKWKRSWLSVGPVQPSRPSWCWRGHNQPFGAGTLRPRRGLQPERRRRQ